MNGVKKPDSGVTWGSGDVITLEVDVDGDRISIQKQDKLIREDSLPEGPQLFYPAVVMNRKSEVMIMYD